MAKFCINCGHELDNNQDLCLGCGALVNEKSNNKKKKLNGLAVSGFIISIFSLLGCCLPFTFIIGIVSLILCIIGLVKSKTLNDGKGLSISGIVISSIAICLSTLVSFLFFLIVIFEIEESEANHACFKEYGSEYRAVEGYDIYYYEDYDWYCCLKNDLNNCKKLDR